MDVDADHQDVQIGRDFPYLLNPDQKHSFPSHAPPTEDQVWKSHVCRVDRTWHGYTGKPLFLSWEKAWTGGKPDDFKFRWTNHHECELREELWAEASAAGLQSLVKKAMVERMGRVAAIDLADMWVNAYAHVKVATIDGPRPGPRELNTVQYEYVEEEGGWKGKEVEGCGNNGGKGLARWELEQQVRSSKKQQQAGTTDERDRQVKTMRKEATAQTARLQKMQASLSDAKDTVDFLKDELNKEKAKNSDLGANVRALLPPVSRLYHTLGERNPATWTKNQRINYAKQVWRGTAPGVWNALDGASIAIRRLRSRLG